MDNYQLRDNIIIIYIACERRNFFLQVRRKPGHPNVTWLNIPDRLPAHCPLTWSVCPGVYRVLPINFAHIWYLLTSGLKLCTKHHASFFLLFNNHCILSFMNWHIQCYMNAEISYLESNLNHRPARALISLPNMDNMEFGCSAPRLFFSFSPIRQIAPNRGSEGWRMAKANKLFWLSKSWILSLNMWYLSQ